MATAIMRIQKELKLIQRQPIEGFVITSHETAADGVQTIKGILDGAVGTPYEFGKFPLELYIPTTYPTNPPTAKFIGVPFHPNISNTVHTLGRVCLSILSNTGENGWTPVMTITSVITSIRALLSMPNPDSPNNPEAAALYVADPKHDYNRASLTPYEQTVRELMIRDRLYQPSAAASGGSGGGGGGSGGGGGGGGGGAASGGASGNSKQKYLKYKEKYMKLKNQLGGSSASAMGLMRIAKELKIVKKGVPGFKLTHATDTIWHGVLDGPSGTPYEGCKYPVRIDFFGLGNYPTSPPSITFMGRPPLHVNIYREGLICVDILSTAWSPANQIAVIMPALQTLLAEPNPLSAANPGANPRGVGFVENVKSECAKNAELLKSEFFSGVAMGEAVAGGGGGGASAGGAGNSKYLNLFNWF